MRETRNSITDVWGQRTPYVGAWTVRVNERVLQEPDHWVQSACVLCSNSCGMDIGVKNGRIVSVRGRAVDAVNMGRLGPKGLHGWQANTSPDRLTHPMIRRNGQLQQATWDEAMELIVQRSKDIVKEYTSGAIGFYTSGQLFIEEYYTLSVLGKGGLGTPHMDGNTRLCTATAGAAMKESFGCDGQVGSYRDIDTTDAILHLGHNIASQQTVLWMRILDQLGRAKPAQAGGDRSALHVYGPRSRRAPFAACRHQHRGDERLAEPHQNRQIDQAYIDAHTVGFDKLKEIVSQWTPERVEQVAGVPADQLRAAANILGSARTLLSTVLQGVYQSNQATAAACQVNNLHLIRGLIGKDGCGILQMNGQPTAYPRNRRRRRSARLSQLG